MGERFLALEEAADELDAIQPALGDRFRVANGLPASGRAAERSGPDAEAGGEAVPGPQTGTVTGPAGGRHDDGGHHVTMAVGDRDIRSGCTCGEWTCEVDRDGIDTMVVQIRAHLGSVHATSDDGITVEAPSTLAGRRVG